MTPDNMPSVRAGDRRRSASTCSNGEVRSLEILHLNGHVNGKDVSYDVHDVSEDDDVVPEVGVLQKDDASDKDYPTTVLVTEESLWSIFRQAVIPFLLGGLGTVCAGLVLDIVQYWPAFITVTELFIVVPPLLGLKGNLEMTLAARLSTQANLGHMDTLQEQWNIALGNMALVQCQACVLSFLSSVFAIIMGLASDADFKLHEALFVASCSMTTAAIASFLLGAVMILVVVYSRKCRINPDNIATSVVDALGDITTLAILAGVSSLFFRRLGEPGIASAVIVCLLLLLPMWIYFAKMNPASNKVLRVGWWPIITAMAISSVGGYILDLAVTRFNSLAIFQPVINGVNGNLAAIHASRLSTMFAQRSPLGSHPEDDSQYCVDPFTGLCRRNRQARVSQLLVLLSIPGHIIFVFLIYIISMGHIILTAALLFTYLTASLILLLVLLYLARCGTYWMWRRKIDPDNAIIPLLTGLGDMMGTALLFLSFLLLAAVRDSSVINDSGLPHVTRNSTQLT